MNKFAFYLFTILLMAFSSAHALEKTADLYTGTVPVASREPAARAAAIQAAYAQMLTKLTGDSSLSQTQLLDPLALEAEVTRYAYRETEDPSNPLQLYVQFDPKKTRALLQQANKPLWEGYRPHILIWIVVKNPTERTVLHSTGPFSPFAHNTKMALENILQTQYALPVIWPLWDTQEQSELTMSDLTGFFWNPILTTSKPYRADVILTGSITEAANGQWLGRFEARRSSQTPSEEQAWQWELDASAAQPLLEKSAQYLFQQLAPYYSHQSEQETTWTLLIDAVNSLSTYHTVLHTVSELPGIKSVNLIRISPTRIELQVVSTYPDQSSLQAVFAQQSLLLPVNPAPSDNVLHYKYVP